MNSTCMCSSAEKLGYAIKAPFSHCLNVHYPAVAIIFIGRGADYGGAGHMHA